MSHEPDELYTLRAQYTLGHFALAVQEAKQVARRPMSANLKVEREEYLNRAYCALRQYDKCVTAPGDGAGLQALALKAQYEAAADNISKQKRILDQLKSLATSDPDSTAQTTAAEVCLAADDTAAAWNFVSNATTPEMMACKLQILLKLDRPDLAQQQLALMKKENEESVLGELSSVYLQLYQGSSQAGDAEHTLNSLTEQYGPSVFLLNLSAAALAVQGDYAAAETKLQEALKDFAEIQPQHETYMNLIAVLHQQNKKAEAAAVVETLLGSTLPNGTSLAFKEGLQRVTAAFDREAIKYKV